MTDIRNMQPFARLDTEYTPLTSSEFADISKLNRQLHLNGLSVPPIESLNTYDGEFACANPTFTRQDYINYYKARHGVADAKYNMFSTMTRYEIEKLVLNARAYLKYLDQIQKFNSIYDAYESEQKHIVNSRAICDELFNSTNGKLVHIQLPKLPSGKYVTPIDVEKYGWKQYTYTLADDILTIYEVDDGVMITLNKRTLNLDNIKQPTTEIEGLIYGELVSLYSDKFPIHINSPLGYKSVPNVLPIEDPLKLINYSVKNNALYINAYVKN